MARYRKKPCSGLRFVKNSAFFSAEAGLAVLLMMAFISSLSSSLPPQHAGAGEKLIAAQKAHDLLIVWAQTEAGISEMGTDANLFLGRGYIIEAGGRKIIGMPMPQKDGKNIFTITEEIIVREGEGFPKIKLSILQ